MICRTYGPRETELVAKELAQRSTKRNRTSENRALVIALEGELGAGKTTFIRAYAKALGVASRITSPTFIIFKEYMIKAHAYTTLVHIDAYRLNDHKDLLVLGIKEMLDDPRRIVMIEWAERVEKILPEKHTTVHIDHIDTTTRKIKIK